MLYASTKATFKKQFGASQIKDEYYANTKEEITLAGYRKHLAVDAAPGPLTRQEEEMKEIKETESRVEISVETKHNTLSALSFPFQLEATEAISPTSTALVKSDPARRTRTSRRSKTAIMTPQPLRQ